MDTVLERRFAAIGARLSLAERPWLGAPQIDVRSDPAGEHFDIRFAGDGPEVEVEAIDVRPRQRHLLLLVRDGEAKSKFLCGHDERHWFVAAVPEGVRGVTGVATAMEALQPLAVRREAARLRSKDRLRRRNAAFVRQGEWFFVPTALWPEPLSTQVLLDEPLSRGRGKAHVMQFAFRRGGEVVYVSDDERRVITAAQFVRLGSRQRQTGWTQRARNSQVYAKGAVRHPDHATIHLPGWHRVFMNTEHQSHAMRHVAFID